MNPDHIDSDRLVVLAAALDSGSAHESAHLELCAECRREIDLLRVARRIGTVALPPIDSDRVIVAVRARLAEPEAPVTMRRSARWLVGLAAAAALLLAVRFAGFDAGSAPGGPVPAAVEAASLLHELDDLSVPELEAVLSTLPSSAEAMPHVEELSDLRTSDLERVLRSMEE